MTEVLERVESIGFTTTMGPVDFIYEWPSEPKKQQIAELGDKLVQGLRLDVGVKDAHLVTPRLGDGAQVGQP